MGVSRILGGLLLVACVAIVIAHIWFGYFADGFLSPGIPLAFALPVTVGVLLVAGIGFWLGWIMVSTKEISPSTPAPESKRKRTKRE